VRFSDAAVADSAEQADWYDAQSGQRLANRWEKAVTDALLRISDNPQAGGLCAFQAAELRDIRRQAIKGLPKHLFVVPLPRRRTLALRIVRGARDLESLFQLPNPFAIRVPRPLKSSFAQSPRYSVSTIA